MTPVLRFWLPLAAVLAAGLWVVAAALGCETVVLFQQKQGA